MATIKQIENVRNFIGRNIRYYDGKKWWCSSVKTLNIPMSGDIEVIIDKRHNKWFSIKSLLNGDSWVKKIEILNHHDNRVSKYKTTTFVIENKRYIEAINNQVVSLQDKSEESGW